MNHSVNTKTNPLRSAISAEAILDHLVTATMVLDDDLEVVFVNSAAESLLHCSAAQIRGTPLNHVLLSAEALQTNLRKALREYQPFTARETILQLPDNVQEEVDLSFPTHWNRSGATRGGSRSITRDPQSNFCFMWSSHTACEPGESKMYLYAQCSSVE